MINGHRNEGDIMNTALLDFVRKNGLGKDIRLSIGLDKIANKLSPNGNQSRYLRCFLDGHEVTGMVASLCGFTTSNAKDTRGCIIVHGCGMDMGFYVQSKVYSCAFENGEKEMFDKSNYNYIGKRMRNGKYSYQ